MGHPRAERREDRIRESHKVLQRNVFRRERNSTQHYSNGPLPGPGLKLNGCYVKSRRSLAERGADQNKDRCDHHRSHLEHHRLHLVATLRIGAAGGQAPTGCPLNEVSLGRASN